MSYVLCGIITLFCMVFSIKFSKQVSEPVHENVFKRLAIIYDEDVVNIYSEDGLGTKIEILIPKNKEVNEIS